jgi:putative transposase
MARLPRLVVPSQPHHLIQQGHDGQLIFRDEQDYQQFLVWLKESAKEYKVAIHAYVLMPDHLHLLASPATESGLAQMMQRVGRYYVPWFNAKYGRSGTLFRGRFKTSLLEAAPYFLACSRFVELNPVRAQLAADPGDYPWSSYAHHAGLRPDPVITDHALYWALGNTPFQREAAYIELAGGPLAAAMLEEIKHALLTGWPLGSQAFKTELQLKAKRQVLPARRGRPFKNPPGGGEQPA